MNDTIEKPPPPPIPAKYDRDTRLKLLSMSLDDIEHNRIANENRLRQLTRNEPDEDGTVRGFGLPADHPTVKRLSTIVDQFADLEHKTILMLQNEMRTHPLGEFIENTPGIGLKQGARLLASVSPIRWNRAEGRERTISELWSFAGLGLWTLEDGTKVVYKREKGRVANWSPEAKTRAYLVAVSCVKALSSPYRAVYDERRAHTAEKLHERPCVRCGPSGKPAQPGVPLSAGHRHADAIRFVSKRILRDLYLEAERLEA